MRRDVSGTRVSGPGDFSMPSIRERLKSSAAHGAPRRYAALPWRMTPLSESLVARPSTNDSLRLRAGGEKLAPDAKRPRRDVKALLREQGVAPWQRAHVPFLWSGERLVWVAGLGIDRDFQAGPHVAGVTPVWRIDRVSG